MNRNKRNRSLYASSLIEASLDPLVTISPEGKITDMNQATINITGSSREALTGSNFIDYFTEPEKARLIYSEVFEKGFVLDYPLTIRDHNLTDVLFNGSVYKDAKGAVVGAVVVARDITEQKRIQSELTEAKIFAELATEIAEHAKRLAEKATQTATIALKAKQQFLSNMSHEIRTPMNAIIGFTKVLMKTELSIKQKEYLSAIKLSGDSLIVLINDILDLAKVDAGKMIFEKIPFNLETSVSAMLQLFEARIQEKNIQLIRKYDQRVPKILLGDPARLHQIFLNLLSNAVKFTSKGTITVEIERISEDEDTVTIKFSVRDTGNGIPKEKLSTVFENFQQASSNTSRLYGGTGLGLAIVKQLVESQGGSIQVESEVNQGSTFIFSLTFCKTNMNEEPDIPKGDENEGIMELNVLVVEDIPLNQLLMKTLLEDYGFKYAIADNGKIAIEKLSEENFDIILMDLQMPEMNGFEATAYIRNQMNSSIPIIALTADVTTVDLTKCKAVGMNDYIAKPVDEKLLLQKIVGFFRNPEQRLQDDTSNKMIKDAANLKYINLKYLANRTKSNPALMLEMITLFLNQTPILMQEMKVLLHQKAWSSLESTVHKMIPSFMIMGIPVEFEDLAKKVQEYAGTKLHTEEIAGLINQLEIVCMESCNELKREFNRIKKQQQVNE